jgi:hypothetical protein
MKTSPFKTFLIFACLLLTTPWTYATEGDSLWSRHYGGDDDDFAWSVIATTDGGYLLGGWTQSFGSGMDDVWLLKTNFQGDSLWNLSYGILTDDRAEAVIEVPDGYLAAGFSNGIVSGEKDMLLLKTDLDGNLLWHRTYGGASPDQARALAPVAGGGCVMAGNTASYGVAGSDLWMLKVDSEGDSIWSRTFGGEGTEWAYAVTPASDGGFVAAGITTSFGAGGNDMWLVKASANGDSLWSHTYGGNSQDEARAVIETSDGGFLIAGQTYSFGSFLTDMWVVKTDANGDSLWSRTFGAIDEDEAWDVVETSDGGYLIAGMTESFGSGDKDMWLVKMSLDGDSLWSQTYGGPAADGAYALVQDFYGDYILAGKSWSFSAGRNDMWLVCAEGPDTGIKPSAPNMPLNYALSVFPNPFNPHTLICFQMPVPGDLQIYLYDLQGKVIATLSDGWQLPGSYQIPLDASDHSSGIYFARFTAGGVQQTQKLVLMK